MKAHILIVEDQPALYERLRRALVKHRFTIDEYTKSYDEALERIETHKPDIVLLDIDLHGKKDGIDLGKVLHNKYQIPFIYVTDFDDDITFTKGLHSNHEQFIVKTKPHLNVDDVVRAIHTVLFKIKNGESIIDKQGVIGLVDYLEEIKNFGSKTISKVPVPFEDILFFSIKPTPNNKEKIKTNYLWFQTKDHKHYFLRTSLKELATKLPDYFVRINDSYIINISPTFLKGRINGTQIALDNQILKVSPTYKKKFNTALERMYME